MASGTMLKSLGLLAGTALLLGACADLNGLAGPQTPYSPHTTATGAPVCIPRETRSTDKPASTPTPSVQDNHENCARESTDDSRR